ncbi:efflux RND transporter periplasmic adaptor subunit [Kordiimonas marina]|uniref:efflux RND transporter periplasmic adaptor subunit n=1 Tax=Kordiimonas marina TaxID=2872312 RepID=UPI001FF4F60A|nr:efflux RND transporter periplasmic adaptor subunit [Kordiimonas marina]MCJ9428851.1 efflux RND transporter periplasmic adaptor subunit [Kordiimonas marina]
MFLKHAVAAFLLSGVAAGMASAAPIELTQAQIDHLGIRLKTVEAAQKMSLSTLPGKITAPMNARLAVAAPFAGSVMSLAALEGKAVKKGDTLLTIASGDYLTGRSEMQQHKAEYQTAKAAAVRLRKLAKEGIIAEARAQEAEARAKQLKAALNALERRLSLAAADPKQTGVYRLTAPRDARVAVVDAEPGDMVDAMETVVTLETSADAWVEAKLPPALVGAVSEGYEISVAPGDLKGHVIAVGKVINPKTHSATVRGVLDSAGKLPLGHAVQVTVFAPAPDGSIAVPRSAIIRVDGKETIFVANGKSFDAVQVDVLALGAEMATVTGPVKPGATVAVAGVSALKAIAQQE